MYNKIRQRFQRAYIDNFTIMERLANCFQLFKNNLPKTYMKRIMGLIITFNPSHDLFSNINVFLDQLDHVVIVDNGSNLDGRLLLEQEVSHRQSSLTIIFNDTNLGVATALNQGFQWGIDHNFDGIVTFDQDSQPAPNMIQELLNAYESHPNHDGVAIVAPQVVSSHGDIRVRYLRERSVFLFERVVCKNDSIIENVSTIITSGSLNNLDVYKKIGPFRDDFFIDYVDTEYCLRIKQYGYKIIVTCRANLQHRLGNQQTRHIGPFTLHPTFHSPRRWYYINRNRIAMLRLYAVKFPHWGIYDLMAGFYFLLKLLLFEDKKIKKIQAAILGIYDGLLRRMGPIPSRYEIIFSDKLSE